MGISTTLVSTAGITGLVMSAGCASRPKREPDQSMALYQLGVENFRNRRVEAAIEELDKAVKADPENADAYNMLGLIALNQGHDYVMQVESVDCLKGRDAEMVRSDSVRKFREADAHFRKALVLRPQFPEASNNLAVALLQLQEWDGAILASLTALKDPTYTQPEVARANLGWAYYQKKDLQNAWKELHEATSRAPNFCVGRYRMAKIYVDRGDVDQAAAHIDAVVADETRCNIQEAFLLAGMVHQRRKDAQRAKTLFERCAAMASRSCVANECRRYAQLVH